MWKVVKSFLYLLPSTFHFQPSNSSGGPLKDLLDTPSFLFAQRTGLDQQNLVSDMTFILFVVGFYFRPLPDIFLINGVKDETIDHDHNGLIHLIA